jgi:polyphosphate:AMP phosphotransferase
MTKAKEPESQLIWQPLAKKFSILSLRFERDHSFTQGLSGPEFLINFLINDDKGRDILMFERFDLTKKTDDKEFLKEIEPLQKQMGILQRDLRDKKIPVIIVVEGWNASGITMVMNELIHFLDPRGFSLHSIGSPSEDERARPLLLRFWEKIPAKGRIALFARSWYSRSLAETISGIEWKRGIKRSLSQINQFERQLADDGTIVLKFFLHISKEEQKKRLDEREQNLLTSWMITKGDWDFHNQYDSYLPVIEEFIEGTDRHYAPWVIIEATDRNYTILKVFSAVIKTLEKNLAASDQKAKEKVGNSEISRPKKVEVRRKSLPAVTLTRPEYEHNLVTCQEQVRDIQYQFYKRKIPLMIVYEGWDAAGKGGNIMRLVRQMNPRGYDVIPISRPNDTENTYHYLWRFVRHFPREGQLTIFDRSWYGRVLVERVEGFCSETEWKRAYSEINEMEETYVENGGGMIKFWLEIDKDEQIRRFRQREKDPLKEWKITDEDWRNREKWDLYEGAVDEMLARTNTPAAPWTVVESGNKWYARLKTLQTVISYGERIL